MEILTTIDQENTCGGIGLGTIFYISIGSTISNQQNGPLPVDDLGTGHSGEIWFP